MKLKLKNISQLKSHCNHDNVYGAVITAQLLQEFTSSSDECRTASSGHYPPDQGMVPD